MADAGARDDRRRAMGVGGWIAVVWLAVVAFGGAFGSLLPLDDPNLQAPCATKQPERRLGDDGQPLVVDGRYVLDARPGCPLQDAADDRPAAVPSTRHLLGTDQIGRDTLSRLVAGSRTSLVVAIGSVVVAIVLGGLLGATMAFVGGWFDKALSAVFVGVVAMPAIVVAISVVTALGRSLASVWLALSIVGIPAFAMLVRSQALSVVNREYVMVSTMLGSGRPRTLIREVIPNLVPFAFTYLGLGIAIAIGAEGGLAVLGLSVDEPATSWGSMISQGRPLIERYPHVALIPTVALFATVWAATRVSDVARTHFDIRESLI